MALETSARSILLTISKLLSGMECHGQTLRRPSKSPDCHAEGCPLEAQSPTDRTPQTCTHEGNRRGIICEGWARTLLGPCSHYARASGFAVSSASPKNL